jgi:asparagine synthase (glutamine-hydrolysing)
LSGSPFERYVVWSEDGFGEAEKMRLWPASRNGRLTPTVEFLAAKFQGLAELDQVNLFMAVDLNLSLADCLLVKMDIATMAHGLEARSPFLDHRIVELASHIPPGIKLQGLDGKPILRRIARKYLPENIVRAPKRGFEIPLTKWLQEDLSGLVQEVCLSRQGIIARLFDRKYVEDIVFQRQPMDARRWSRLVWILFMLGMWDQVHENRLDRA